MNKTYNRMFNLVVNSNRTDELARVEPHVPRASTHGGAPTEFGRVRGRVNKGGRDESKPGSTHGGAPTVAFDIVKGKVNKGGRDEFKNPTPTKGGGPVDANGRPIGKVSKGGRRIS